jgi:hypothetical protein
MAWPLGLTSLKEIDKDEFEYWKKASTAALSDCGGRCLRPLWFDSDPSEASQGSQSNEQCSGKHSIALCQMSRDRTQENCSSNVQNLCRCFSAKEITAFHDLRERVMQKRAGQNIGKVAMGIEARMDRLKAIGNGQVPIVAATAFSILRGR